MAGLGPPALRGTSRGNVARPGENALQQQELSTHPLGKETKLVGSGFFADKTQNWS